MQKLKGRRKPRGKGTGPALSTSLPCLNCNLNLASSPGSSADSEFTGCSRGGKHSNAFHYLKEKKTRKTQKPTPLSELWEEMNPSDHLPFTLGHPGAASRGSAAQQPQGSEALRGMEEGV